MNEDKSFKTLEFLTDHYNHIKVMSYPLFVGTINELSGMANGGDFYGNRATMFPCPFHTDQFFVDLLHNLGYDKDGSPLNK